MAITNTLLNIHKAIAKTTAKTIHNTMPKIIPPNPSPASNGPEAAKSAEIPEVSIGLNLSVTRPRLSFSLTPLKSPMVMNEKKAIDKMVVEMIELSKNVWCRPSPQK